MNASERLPEGSPKGGRSPILKFKEALKDTLRLMLLDCFQQLLKINQRFLSDYSGSEAQGGRQHHAERSSCRWRSVSGSMARSLA